MKRILIAGLAVGAISAHAGNDLLITAELVKTLPSPPYGAYYVDYVHQRPQEMLAWRKAISDKFGVPSNSRGYLDPNFCAVVDGESFCARGLMLARREKAAETELKKYGFKSWEAAEIGCNAAWSKLNWSMPGGPKEVQYCGSDPFLRLRLEHQP